MPLPRPSALALLIALVAGVATPLGAVAGGADRGPLSSPSNEAMRDAQRLTAAGDRAGALAKVDGILADHPNDIAARFLRGLLLTDLKRTDDAMAAFKALTEAVPELPEPHNNLGVLYASQGRMDDARAALEGAIRAKPDYATAMENLADVYARMAVSLWDKAAMADRTSASARQKRDAVTPLLAKPVLSVSTPGAAVKP